MTSPIPLLAVRPAGSDDSRGATGGGIVPRIAAAMSVLLGVLVLGGWAADAAVLRRLSLADTAAMNPLAAICFVLLGASLVLSLMETPAPARRAAIAGACIVAAMVAVRLLDASVTAGGGIDSLFFHDAMLSTGDGRTNRMAPASAASFLMLASALLCLGRPGRASVVVAHVLGIAVLLLAQIALIAHAYKSGWFNTVGAFSRMAPHTAFGLTVLSIGVLAARPRCGLVAVVTGDGPGGAMARRMLPAGMLVPPILGWLVLSARRAELFPPELGDTLFVVATMLIFAGLVSWNAVQLHHSHVERTRAEAALRDSEARFRLLAENGSDLVSLESPEGREIYVSPSSERLLGYTPLELARMPAFALVHADDRGRVLEHHDAIMRGEPSPAISYRAMRKSGEYVWLERLTRAVIDRDGRVVRLQSSSRDVTERKAYLRQLEEARIELQQRQGQLLVANARLESLATLDGLTTLKNRRAFETRLSDEVERSGRSGAPLSLLLLDIDHFKQFNDAFGHPSGDGVLREVARLLANAVRATDLAARYGGEEFAIILPETTLDEALLLAERLRVAIEAAPWRERAITASVGGAALGPACSSSDALVDRADRALYRSKQRGRNVVTGADAT